MTKQIKKQNKTIDYDSLYRNEAVYLNNFKRDQNPLDIGDDSEDDGVDISLPTPSENKQEYSPTFNPFGPRAHGIHNPTGYVFVVDGKRVSPDEVYNTMNLAAYIAATWCMQHDEVADDNALELHTYVMLDMLSLYGPKRVVSQEAVRASIVHIRTRKLDPFDVMVAKKRAIRDDAPKKVLSNAVVSGVTAFEVDTFSGTIEVPDRPDLTVQAQEAMGNIARSLYQAPMTKLHSAVETITGLNSNIKPVLQQVQGSLDNGAVHPIKETNAFREIAQAYGMMSTDILVNGTHGLLQLAHSCLNRYMSKPADVLFVPGYKQTVTGDWASNSSSSRVIPFPEGEPHLYSMVLGSIVQNYEKLFSDACDIERDVAARVLSGNARQRLHAPYEKYYMEYAYKPVFTTVTGVTGVTMWGHKPISAVELESEMRENTAVDEYPVLMRASEYHKFLSAGHTESQFIFIDLPSMMGLRISRSYALQHFSSSMMSGNDVKSSKKGWYVFNNTKIRSSGSYSTAIMKFVLYFLVSRAVGKPEILDTAIEKYMAGTKGHTKMYAGEIAVFKALKTVYGHVMPELSKTVVLVPGYSATKAMAHSTYSLESEDPVPYDTSPNKITLVETNSDRETDSDDSEEADFGTDEVEVASDDN